MKILLLGASGFLGGVLWCHLAQRHEVVGTCYTRSIPGLLPLDLCDNEALDVLLKNSFDLVIHTAGLVDGEAAERDPQWAWNVNVRSVQHLVKSVSSKIVYFSSDNVFDGTRPFYLEQDQPTPINVYGWSKRQAELIVLRDPCHLIVRVPFLFGWSPWSDKFLSRFSKAVTLAPVDIFCNPVYLPTLAIALESFWHLSGILHFGGSTILSRYDFFSLAQRYLALTTQVQPVLSHELVGMYRRPPHAILYSERLTLLEGNIPNAFKDLRQQLHGVGIVD